MNPAAPPSKFDIRNSKFENIFLIGYRGTGKTTIARIVAERLGWSTVDADELLEARQGRAIQQIFAEEGEAGFRDKEAALLEEVCGLKKHVVATGGGVVLRAGNRDRLRAAGLIVWLTADVDTIWRRLQADPSTAQRRPDLSVGGRAEIEELLQLREPLYRECAHLTVAGAGRAPEAVAREVLSLREQFLRTSAPD